MFNHPEECLVFYFDVKAVDDEEDSDIFRNLFQDQIADFSMQKPSGFYSDFPVFDKYSDDEEDFKDLLSNEISSNPIYQLRDDQKSMNAMVENRYESIVQESNEDPFNFDTSSKDIIVGSIWGTEFFISDFLKSEFQNCKYLLPGHVLKFAAAPVIVLLKDGSIIKFVSRILAWLIWKFSYT
jgi:hypothetical protein